MAITVTEQQIISPIFRKNQYDHWVFRVTGSGLAGDQEISRLKNVRFRVDEKAKAFLLSTEWNGYNDKHRLVAGKEYEIVLVPTTGIKYNPPRLTLNQLSRYVGYTMPQAEIAIRSREIISDEKMKEIRFQYIIIPHHVAVNQYSDLVIWNALWLDNKSMLCASLNHTDIHWDDNGAFAFVYDKHMTKDQFLEYRCSL